MKSTDAAWIGVDLDGTLAMYDKWRGPTHIGQPIPRMMDRVRTWLAIGQKVKIVTARVAPNNECAKQSRAAIRAWLDRHGLSKLEITHGKDHKMIELWDDRAVQVIPNTAARVDCLELVECQQPEAGKWCSARTAEGKCKAISPSRHNFPPCDYRS